MTIKIIKEKVSSQVLKNLAQETYIDMIKAVVDIDKNVIALGGELHADAEALLLEQGSSQESLWGFNIYLIKPKEDRLEYTSFINIRPSHGNKAMEIQSQQIKKKIKQIVDNLIPHD